MPTNKKVMVTVPVDLLKMIDNLVDKGVFATRSSFFQQLTFAFNADCKHYQDNLTSIGAMRSLALYVIHSLSGDDNRKIFSEAPKS